MSSVNLSIVSAASIKIDPVRYQVAHPVDRPAYVYATQWIDVITDDGRTTSICIHLGNACASLIASELVNLPTVEDAERGQP